MKAGVAGLMLLSGVLLACGRQELWKPGATGGNVGSIGGSGGAIVASGSGGAIVASGGAGASGGAAGGASGGAGAPGSDDAGSPPDAVQPFDDGFDVGSLPGLVLWLDAVRGVTMSPASTGSTFNVMSWKDQSPSGNDVGNTGQEAASFFPGDFHNWYWGGGAPVIDLDFFATMATRDRTNGTPTLGLGTGDLLVEVVAAWRNDTFARPSPISLGRVVDTGSLTFLIFDTQSNGAPGNITLRLSNDPLISSPNVSNNKLRLLGAHRAVTGGLATVELRVDGRVDQVSMGAPPRDLGAAAFAQVGPACDVAEVVIIKGPIAPAALAALESHLKAKYGL
jgi:hypothetical protein